MKPRRLLELRTLLSHPDFQEWWSALSQRRGELVTARARYEELLSQTTLMEFRAELTQKNAIDTLYRAGELEDVAASMVAEAQGLENRSMSVLAEFEEHRFITSEFWYRLGAAEKTLEEKREAHLGAPSKKTEQELKAAEKTHREATFGHEREEEKKRRLWDEVEGIWARSAEVSLLVSEHRLRGRKVRREAEGMFGLAEERKVRAKELRAEADGAARAVEAQEREIKALLDSAREQFSCAPGTEFLFFRRKDNQKLSWALSLIEDRENFNVEVKALAVYSVDKQRGVSFLEPARSDSPSMEEGDRRFEQYFLSGRKGEVRSVGA